MYNQLSHEPLLSQLQTVMIDNITIHNTNLSSDKPHTSKHRNNDGGRHTFMS